MLGGSSYNFGVISVVASEGALYKADITATANAIQLSPYINGTAVNGATDGGKAITEWRCGPAATNPLPAKYLPGSCKAA